jgi:hypothetical protein
VPNAICLPHFRISLARPRFSVQSELEVDASGAWFLRGRSEAKGGAPVIDEVSPIKCPQPSEGRGGPFWRASFSRARWASIRALRARRARACDRIRCRQRVGDLPWETPRRFDGVALGSQPGKKVLRAFDDRFLRTFGFVHQDGDSGKFLKWRESGIIAGGVQRILGQKGAIID